MKSQIIGKTVTVTVDRPIGSRHPNYPDIIYPINYGYITVITAGDGEEQDAYILGVNKPLKNFTGLIAAVIHRKNDIENKWIVVPEGFFPSKTDIISLTAFQEQFFDIEIIM